MTDPVADLAGQIKPTEQVVEPTTTRVAVVTAMESSGERRVQLDISSTAWVNRLQDCKLDEGDRVAVLQQGPVLLVIGRLTGTDGFTPVGSVLPYAGASAPTGWLICNGQAVSRSVYSDLYAVCGTTYGVGNGTTTFNVPDLRDRLPMGAGTSYPRGDTDTGQTTLTTSHLPGHTHTLSSGSVSSAGSHDHNISGSTDSGGSHSHSESAAGTRSDILAGGGTTVGTSTGGTTGSGGSHSHGMSGGTDSGGSHSHTLSGSTGSSGSGNAFTTTGPYQALAYIIRAL